MRTLSIDEEYRPEEKEKLTQHGTIQCTAEDFMGKSLLAFCSVHEKMAEGLSLFSCNTNRTMTRQRPLFSAQWHSAVRCQGIYHSLVIRFWMCVCVYVCVRVRDENVR